MQCRDLHFQGVPPRGSNLQRSVSRLQRGLHVFEPFRRLLTKQRQTNKNCEDTRNVSCPRLCGVPIYEIVSLLLGSLNISLLLFLLLYYCYYYYYCYYIYMIYQTMNPLPFDCENMQKPWS